MLNDCDLVESCNGAAAACPPDQVASPGASCESVSTCMTGGQCTGGVCSGGTPVLVPSTDQVNFTSTDRDDAAITLTHTGSSGSFVVTSATLTPASEAFTLAEVPSWPVTLEAGESTTVKVRLLALQAGTFSTTLSFQAEGCAGRPVAVSATLATDAPGPGCGGCSAASPALSAAALLLLGLRLRRRRWGVR